jgi:phospholipase/carboxylesterase
MAFELITLDTAEQPDATVIWLHGLGADGHDFEPIVSELKLPQDLAIRFIFPHAPVRPVTTHGGMPLRAWYDLLNWEFGGPVDSVGIAESVASIQRIIVKEITRGIPSHRIILAGFSQGGAIALHAALSCQSPLGGVIGLSTYFPLPEKLAAMHSANQGIPVFLAHGQQDSVVPMWLGEKIKQDFEDQGLKPEWFAYPMAHCVCDQEIKTLGGWITARLS